MEEEVLTQRKRNDLPKATWISGMDWIRFQWQITVGDLSVTEKLGGG